ncbi:MAG TPA: transposase, partial [Steroidobacteraceae bacterium]|nr:transposase [Steroidobacteraceae bacterium]
MGKIAAIHRRSRDTYGAPNIHAELADDNGIRVGRKRVARLIRQSCLRGATLRRFVVITQSDPAAPTPSIWWNAASSPRLLTSFGWR